MSRTFELVRGKLAEAEFFLSRMESSGTNVFEFRCYFSAFVSAARSVTFSLQAAMSDTDGFEEWYAEKREQLGRQPLARFFLGMRNEVLKTGDTSVNVGVMRVDVDGRPAVRHYFTGLNPEDDLALAGSDVMTAAKSYLELVGQVVVECLKRFAYVVDEDVYFSEEGLKSRGQTIEDVEEMLGFPRGWTQGLPDTDRLTLLKESASPKVVESIGLSLRSLLEDAD